MHSIQLKQKTNTHIFNIDFLNIDEIDSAISFLEYMRKLQPINAKHHLKPKEYSNFENAINMGGAVIAARNDYNYIISLILFNPQSDKIARLESVCTNPEYRNFGIGNKMLDTAIKFAKSTNKQILHAKIAHDNHNSLKLFLNNGFLPEYSGFDTVGKYNYFIMAINF